ncbi:Leishmanolysin-like peptidase 2 [Bulinus truncatus]|nr:Leishmanolysin-like peptidase 2 [Bulinus truncatus]
MEYKLIQHDLHKTQFPSAAATVTPVLYQIVVVGFDEQLLLEEKEALQQVIEKALRKISRLLSVSSLKGPLLLSRSGCPAVYSKGTNKGKCAKIPHGYKGEYCMDNFKIPDGHLQSYIIYNRTSTTPIYVYKDGPGLQDTDYVLYVTSQTTEYCNPYKSSAVAYAAACQLYGTGRPLAGLVNFCPRTVKTQKFDQEVLYKVASFNIYVKKLLRKAALHELFHALGFSQRLYDRFQKCDEVGNCVPWPQPIVKYSHGMLRLLTDAVVREMGLHFNCSRKDFGGPIELSSPSHWDPVFMYSSIMGSKEQKPYQTLIDPITLAVFEDSGWYQVNYSEADKFIWGKGEGCSFGLKTNCEFQDEFCVENLTGCHHLHLSKARCSFVNSSSCGIYAADQKPCFINALNSSWLEDEIYSPSSRCFLSSLTLIKNKEQEITGRCYETLCKENDYYVRINNSDWLPCQSGTSIQVSNNDGVILCPSYDVICSEFTRMEPEVLGSTSLSETESSTVPDPCILENCFSGMSLIQLCVFSRGS